MVKNGEIHVMLIKQTNNVIGFPAFYWAVVTFSTVLWIVCAWIIFDKAEEPGIAAVIRTL